MSVTINNVARLAGVSITTVSRVINNSTSVKNDTRIRVLKAVKILGFQPNLSARNMGGSKSYVLGYIYDNPNTHYVIGMQNGILNACRDHGYGLMIHPCDSNSNIVLEEFRKLIRTSHISGIILTPPFSERKDITDSLQEMDMEYICIISGKEKTRNTDHLVIINDWISSYNITKHLIDYGHKDIAFLCGEKRHASTAERLDGYLAALKDHDIKADQDLIMDGEYSYESGNKRAKILLTQSPHITAIIGCNDEIAAGAQHAARVLGIDMPARLSVAGFEDSPYSRQTTPKLTTVRQPNRVIAKFATELLINRIRPQKAPPKNTRDNRNLTFETISFENNMFMPELVLRESTAKTPS